MPHPLVPPVQMAVKIRLLSGTYQNRVFEVCVRGSLEIVSRADGNGTLRLEGETFTAVNMTVEIPDAR